MTHTLSFFCFMWTRVVCVCSFRKASVWFDPIAERILDWSEGKNSSGKNRRTRGEWKQKERPMNDKMLHRREIPIEQRNYSCSGTKVRRRETVCCSVGPRNNEPLISFVPCFSAFFPFQQVVWQLNAVLSSDSHKLISKGVLQGWKEAKRNESCCLWSGSERKKCRLSIVHRPRMIGRREWNNRQWRQLALELWLDECSNLSMLNVQVASYGSDYPQERTFMGWMAYIVLAALKPSPPIHLTPSHECWFSLVEMKLVRVQEYKEISMLVLKGKLLTEFSIMSSPPASQSAAKKREGCESSVCSCSCWNGSYSPMQWQDMNKVGLQ